MSVALLSNLRFSGDLPVWLVLPLIAAAVIAVLALYLRETKTIASPYQYLLPSLRATAVALVIFILAGPVWHHRQVVGTLGRVVFAVDTSRSMTLSDSQSDLDRENRLERATSLLLGNSTEPGWLEQMAKTHEVDVIAFDGDAPITIWSSDDREPLPISFDWEADGGQTELASPLATTLSSLNLDSSGEADSESGDYDSLRRAAVVLMSDGRDTSRRRDINSSATSLAKRLASGGTEVHALGLGSSSEPPDVGIVEAIRPETVAAEGKLAGQIVVKRFGNADDPVSVRIESDGEVVWQQSIRMPAAGQQAVPFEIDVQPLVEASRAKSPRGIERTYEVLRLAAKVESPGDDFSAENNAVNFRVSATTRNRKLLIVDSSSRWETRYLKNLFERDPAWETDVVLFGPGTPMPVLRRGEESGSFPATAAQMGGYDAMILGEVDGKQFSVDDRQRIASFVAEGGGLILIDGRHGGLRELGEAELADLMPVRYESRRTNAAPRQLRATPAGLEQPSLVLIDETSRLSEFWEMIPAPKWAADTRLAEGAEAWAEAVWNDDLTTPWLATRMYGAGRVFYFASDQTWRWRYKVADRFHARFWNQLLIAAMEPPYSASDQFVSLGTDKVEYRGDDPIAIRARLRDTLGMPVADATVDALIVQNELVVGSIPLSLENRNRGTYMGIAPPMPGGEYSIRIRASGFDESALLATTPIWVAPKDNLEMQRMSLDEDSLRQIASTGGGKYIHESDAGQMLDLLKPLSSGTVIESDTILWQSALWFWPIIAILGIEWWCRKRAGLV
ncbi:MAG: hypothetical protein AAFX06_19290 [Planctomycetota bacterium]